VIKKALVESSAAERELIARRLLGRPDERYTAEYLAFVLNSWGYQVSATTIRTYRRRADLEGVNA